MKKILSLIGAIMIMATLFALPVGNASAETVDYSWRNIEVVL